MNSLLPPNATQTEKHLEQVTGRGSLLPAPVRDLWNHETCPVEWLPFLAWSLSVDEWSNDWPEAVKREVINQSYDVHRYKGTVASVKSAIAALGFTVELLEWWQPSGSAIPYRFELTLSANNSLQNNEPAITAQALRQLFRIVDKVKPVRSAYKISVVSSFSADIGFASFFQMAQLQQVQSTFVD